MTKKILVSPGFGAGWATWQDDKFKKALAEDPELIELVEAGKHLGTTPPKESGGWPDEASPEFVARANEVAKAIAGDEEFSLYFGGVEQLEVVTVDGPYRINDYDGWEFVQTSIDFW